MKIVIVTRDKRRLASIAIASRLYTPKGKLRASYEKLALGRSVARKDTIAVAYVDDRAIGACHIDRHDNIMIYVKPKFRRKGIGRALIDRVKLVYGKHELHLTSYLGHDKRGSLRFWNNMGITNYLEQVNITEEECTAILNGSLSIDQATFNAKKRAWERLQVQLKT